MFVELVKPFMQQAAGARIDLADADAQALIAAGTAKAIPGNPLSEAIAATMAESMKGITGAIQSAVDLTLKEFAAAQALSRKGAAGRIFGGDMSRDPKQSFGAFLLAVRSRDQKALEEMGSRLVDWDGDVEKKTAMSTTTGTTGGYTVPTQHHDRLMELATEMSVVRPRATVIEMTGREIEVPSLDVTTAQAAGDTAFLGGLVARWTEEGGDKNQSEPSFKQTVLKNFELSGYSKISNAMMADSAVGLESFLFQMFAKAMAWYEDYAFLRGNGVGKPLGVVPWAGLLSATRSAASAFALADMAAMFAKWLGTYDPRSCCWVFQHSVLAKLYAMVSSSTMYIGDFQNTPKGNYLAGLPVLVSEKLPALNTAGDVLLCDWSQYLVGDRKQTEIAFSEHASFTANQTVWRFVRRVGGQPWLKTYVTLADASTTVSPFVALAAG